MIASQSYVRAIQLVGFAEEVEQSGGDALELLARAGIDPVALTDVDIPIPFARVAALMEITANRLNRRHFGLQLAHSTPPHVPNFGPLALLHVGVPTIGEQIAISMRYMRYHTNALHMRLLLDELDPRTGLGRLRYTIDSSVLAGRQTWEYILGIACITGRIASGASLERGMIVRFQHDKPRDTSVHDEVFRCPVEFNRDHNEILAAPEVLSYKVTGASLTRQALLRLYLNLRIARQPRHQPSMTTTVTLAISSVIGSGECNIEYVADALGMHVKRLQRALASEGTTFSDLLEDVRENTARRLLITSEIPIERMAGLLDYASTPPFTLACKRWTGMSPLAFRKAERERLMIVKDD